MNPPSTASAVSLTVVMGVVFGCIATIAFVFAWKRRGHKGSSEITARRAAFIGGVAVVIATLGFIASIWIDAAGLGFAHLANLVLYGTIGGFALIAIFCAVMMIRAVITQADEQIGMIEARQPYRGPDSDHGDPPL